MLFALCCGSSSDYEQCNSHSDCLVSAAAAVIAFVPATATQRIQHTLRTYSLLLLKRGKDGEYDSSLLVTLHAF